ncbi:class I SAM-dependent DNA methyltransferase [Streptomyces phytohabitans]|uniref:class I SAM-dependent DNA methyltransferase n=1 Tax=Streptomyces phytohabitans TaxID=1150371 RepID=UPI00387E67F6
MSAPSGPRATAALPTAAARAVPPVPPAPSGVPWRADPYARALRSGHGPLFLRRPDGWLLPLDVERWCARADAADLTVLRHCAGAVLDIGCGPGRMVAALARWGSPVLGIDTSPAAVARTRRHGVDALCRSVFETLPAEGRWGSALLVDGNIGIGGDPAALLARVGELLTPGGLLLAEAMPGDASLADVDERVEVRLDDGTGGHGPAFPWARIGGAALKRRAESAGWTVGAQWSAHGRTFLALRR